MKHEDSKLATMRDLPIFARCTPKELKQIAALGDRAVVPAGKVLLTEGEHPAEAYVVISGEAIVSRGGTEVARVGGGEQLGEMSLLDGRAPRSATVTAATEMELLVFDVRAFSTMLERHPEVGRHVAATLATRLRLLEDETFG